ncbi:hypothetical protein MLD38_034599 [Melastoma candidum]|uniref:Uncharacterized protein n=1 Tax=Melastoma candidum TaxID=119954 RepID=A0ACB9MEG4_9MYRT|nr:hypothetical protein MLD38_034599 [Melastoma candidum]
MAGRSAMREVVETMEEEPMVPVFTVIKNGAILKNIFVISNGSMPLLEEEEIRPFDLMDDVKGREEVLIVGRHPDCDVVLTHPSISRFHLKILSNPTARKLSIMDLSSVHGTWICDSRIDPGVLVELNEGDTIRVGGSSRVYRLHWVPLSRAYDCENPFMSALDLAVFREEEEENEVTEDATLVEPCQDKYGGEVEIVEAADEEITQNKDLSAVEGFANKSTYLTLEDSIDSLALHDLEKTENSPEFLNPVGGKIPVDLFQINSETRLDNLAHLEAPLRTDNEMCNEEQSKQAISESENPRGLSETEICEAKENAFSGNQWTNSISYFSPALGDVACPFSPATPSETGNQLSEEPVEIMSQTLGAAAETTKVEGDEQSLTEFCPSLEALAYPLSPITPMEIGSPRSGKQEITPLSQMASEPFLQRESCNHPTKWTSYPALSASCVLETEENSTAAVTFTIVGAQNQSGNQKGVLQNHVGGPSRASRTISVVDNNILAEVTHHHSNEENKNAESSYVNRRLFSDREKDTSSLKISAAKSNIWSRRGKPEAVLQLQTGNARSKTSSVNSFEEEEVFTPDKENMTPNTRLLRSLHKFGKKESGEEEGGEEIFTPDKENMTPNIRLLRSLHKIGKLKTEGGREDEEEEEGEMLSLDKENLTPNTRLLKSLNKISKMKGGDLPSDSIKRRSRSKLSCHGSITADCSIPFSEKEKKMLEDLRKQGTEELQWTSHSLLEITGTRKKPARTPLQCLQTSSLSVHATGERNSSVSEMQDTGNTFSKICPMDQDIDRQTTNWTMVVDITSFLDQKSRKSLQLLRGLKGTQLMIPRMVIRELECLKQRSGLFNKATYVSSLLEWIEVCMVTTPWWIHIQTTQEEERSIAPTPPTSPCSTEIPVWGNHCSINSPTSEDHILEHAILLSRTRVDRRVILISNDVTMKIKAMAEGMICETAQEFQASLVNPFSERFMWRSSVAIGQTWSGSHDEVLREIIYHQQPPMKKQSRGPARGLKLILLHNLQYRKQISLK